MLYFIQTHYFKSFLVQGGGKKTQTEAVNVEKTSDTRNNVNPGSVGM